MGLRLCLIGFPIKHSMSPWIHGQLLRKASIEGDYYLNEITSEDSFREKIEQMKQDEVNGFNVTVPYKQKIIPFLNKIDDYAKKVGAVNTVKNENGILTGYNTDGIGFVKGLQDAFPEAMLNNDKKLLLIGAGGAARGIYYALEEAGFGYIDIANRTIERAQNLIEFKKDATVTNLLSLETVDKQLKDYDIVIQTTSVGMKPNEEDSIINVSSVKSGSIFCDIVYQPLKTKFLKQAEEKGANILFGHSMLLYQAQEAFEIWTGTRVPISNLIDELQKELEGR